MPFDQLEQYREMAYDLQTYGKPGDMDTTELIGYDYYINPKNPWFALTERKLKVPFIMKELQWYLDGDPAAAWIGEHAGVWKSVIDHDKRAVSNYGMTAFRDRRLEHVTRILFERPMSRRAIMYFGNNAYVRHHTETKDQPCANSIHWMVRDNVLHTVVSQRSQDYIYGVSGDAVFMTMLTNLVAGALGVEMGLIHVQCASFHHYPKHTEMVKRLVNSEGYELDWMWHHRGDQAVRVMRYGYKADTPFTNWVHEKAWETE